jgi:hypothetical protein
MSATSMPSMDVPLIAPIAVARSLIRRGRCAS